MKISSKFIIFVLFIILILLSIFFIPHIVHAQSPQILISEVFYDTPGTDVQEEWIEIYNPTNSDQGLSGWTFTDLSSNFIFPANTQIEAGDFLIIAKNEAGFFNLYGFNPDVEGLILSLNNSGDQIILKDDQGDDIDAVVYGKGRYCPDPDFCFDPHPGVATGHSLERIPANEDSDDCAMDFVEQIFPSPGTTPVILDEPIDDSQDYIKLNWSISLDKNFSQYQVFRSQKEGDLGELVEIINVISETSFLIEDLTSGKTYYFAIKTVSKNGEKPASSNQIKVITSFQPIYSVIITEILPSPANGSENEFIELYNSGSEIVDLSGWFLDDGVGGSNPFEIPENSLILPGQYLVFYKSKTSIALNDSGDQARLLWPNLELAFGTPSYASAPQGQSWARDSNQAWTWSTTPTPGAKNIISHPEKFDTEPILVNIGEARKLEKGTQAQVEGVVIAVPGLFSDYYFYIQDESGGIQIYYSKAVFPGLKIGDIVSVIGEISSIGGEIRIKIDGVSGIMIIGSSDPPQPKKIKTGEVKNYEGQLVMVSGRITQISGNTFYLDDGSGSIRIYISTKTGIKKPKMFKGDWVTIIGIVSQTKLGFRIMPRLQSDVVYQGKVTASSSKVKLELADIFGAQTALAGSKFGDVLGQDFRMKPHNQIQVLGWTMVIGGIILILGIFSFLFWRKRNV